MAIHFKLLLVFAFCTISASGDLLWSIDCGTPAKSFYTDTNFKPWIGDSDFFQTGTSVGTVESTHFESRVMDTLRIFTSRKKNCYDLKVGAGTKVLVRASFNYGNYDLREFPPTFDILFDGNFWATVDLSPGSVYYEVVYVAKSDYLSVCLVQTKPNQFPFISTLEVSSLDSLMYSKFPSNVALFLTNRVAYGATSTIRYPSDRYDRIWVPGRDDIGHVKVSNEAFLVLNTYTNNHPPLAMLQNAITMFDTPTPLILDSRLPSVGSEIALILYVTEVTKLSKSQKRSFQLFINKQTFSVPILPSYQYSMEIYLTNYTVTPLQILYLAATSDSDLPPLISGMEVFIIRDVLTQGTNINDYEGIVSVRKAFDTALNDWSGDPCLPSPYSWEWVNCSADAIPRITAINLNGYGLEGLIPDLSSMEALETINLQNNNLVGPIPDSLGKLSNLKKLNVADNKLSGLIPTSISNNYNLDLIWTGNPSLCKFGCQVSETQGSVPTILSSTDGGNTPTLTRRKSKKNKAAVILGTIILAVIVFYVVLVVCLRKRKKVAVAVATAGGINRPQSHGRPNLHEKPQSTNALYKPQPPGMPELIRRLNWPQPHRKTLTSEVRRAQPHDKAQLSGGLKRSQPYEMLELTSRLNWPQPHKKLHITAEVNRPQLHGKLELPGGINKSRPHGMLRSPGEVNRPLTHEKQQLTSGLNRPRPHRVLQLPSEINKSQPHGKPQLTSGLNRPQPPVMTELISRLNWSQPHGKPQSIVVVNRPELHDKMQFTGGSNRPQPYGKPQLTSGVNRPQPHGKTQLTNGVHQPQPYGKPKKGWGNKIISEVVSAIGEEVAGAIGEVVRNEFMAIIDTSTSQTSEYF